MKTSRLFDYFFIGVLSIQSFYIFGQDRLINPTPTFLTLMNDVPLFSCNSFNIQQMIDSSKSDILNGASPLVFAKKFDVSITPGNSGRWEEQDGLRIWRLEIESQKAYSMMLIFEELNLPPYSSLFIYSKDMSYVAGPYTETFNESQVLPTPLIPGDSIIVELVYEKDSLVTPPSFMISSISHDYANMFGVLNQVNEDGFAKDILECHFDINCSEGDLWQIEKRAVARIVINGKGLCTGSLINNTLSNRTPYFLTANHCILNGDAAKKSVFYFNYESPECDGPDGQTNHIVSGAQRRSFNPNSDFALLQLNATVPSSYQPFFAGFDKSGSAPNSATVIHHPLGNVKKISFDNDPIVSNPITRAFDNITLPVGTAWDVVLDEGTTEGGSSGAPLFNSNGRIIGQNAGGVPGCPGENGILKHYGKLSVSWNTGNNTQRLRDWLDPNNNLIDVLRGFAPQGWIHNWVTNWNAPTSQNIHSSMKAITVGAGNQIFYRGADNKVHTLYYVANGLWNHAWVNGSNTSSNENIAGDIITDGGNQLFYRGSDGRMHVYYFENNAWHHGWLGGANAPSNHNVHSTAGSIAMGESQVFYRGTDNKMQVYYFANGSWHHDWLNGSTASSTENIAGDVIVIEGNQVVYRGTDGKMHVYYWGNNIWNHGWLGGWNAPSNQNVSSAAGSIESGGDQVFYRGTDNKIHLYYFANNAWHHDWINGSNASSVENVSGDMAVFTNDQVAYRGADGKMHIYYWANNDWNHDWIETSWQAPSIHNVSGSMDIGTNNQLFYRGSDGRCRIYFWEPEFYRSSSSNYNYSFYETKPSPTITDENLVDNFEVIAHPNPVKGELKIRCSGNEQGTSNVSLIDITGRILLNSVIEDSEEKVLDLESIPLGIYILRITDPIGKVGIKKIVKH